MFAHGGVGARDEFGCPTAALKFFAHPKLSLHPMSLLLLVASAATRPQLNVSTLATPPQLNVSAFAACLLRHGGNTSTPEEPPDLPAIKRRYNFSLADGLLIYLALYPSQRLPIINSSVQEAGTNERVLITAIARALANDRPMPCGLPFPLPKFIAICNLSGEKLILYGKSPSLLRRLCTRSSARSKAALDSRESAVDNTYRCENLRSMICTAVGGSARKCCNNAKTTSLVCTSIAFNSEGS